ncbi:hypothetical protein P4S64_13735 [Vibrio sp. M60_M31a]
MSKLDAQRIMERADHLATFTSMQDGLKRTYLSPEHKQAHHQLGEWMLQAGLETWQDSVGNQWGRKVSSNPTMPTLIIGSHSDTVADAGKYDGNAGDIWLVFPRWSSSRMLIYHSMSTLSRLPMKRAPASTVH